ncbi:hypothetical protein K443DRAFT_684119 [Laccaria amethystina LaAM-08-1]|uniref:Uncharacterized protein n=1 Tax=Laccaria amethystina LaAM-08-1 TaxID=1095629 RepID=A0A0C9XCS9_9AGAR|nr:hypothetical protein K443DRAFT_684119 [Laccaria amethystina LaAM-08-1]
MPPHTIAYFQPAIHSRLKSALPLVLTLHVKLSRVFVYAFLLFLSTLIPVACGLGG